jgi:hypothetical protein
MKKLSGYSYIIKNSVINLNHLFQKVLWGKHRPAGGETEVKHLTKVPPRSVQDLKT